MAIKIIFISLCFILFSCSTSTKVLPIAPMQKGTKHLFPDHWLGHWEGLLTIRNRDGSETYIPMKMINEETSFKNTWRWELVYNNNGKEDKRAYLLKAIDAKSGVYAIDELNSIVLQGTHIDNKFISTFEVQNNLLTTNYELDNDKLIFEVFIYNLKDKKSTGNSINQNDTIPSVLSYPLGGSQKAILTKIK
jgi:hypothetical protein